MTTSHREAALKYISFLGSLKVKDQMGKARVSVKTMLKEALEEARRQNAEKKPTGKKKDISR